MEPRDVFVLETIVDFCDRAKEAAKRFGSTQEEFLNDRIFQDTVAFYLLQIGEYVNSLSDAFKNSHHEFPWYKIVGLRNLLTHAYGDVEPEILWKTYAEDVPKLGKFCRELIEK